MNPTERQKQREADIRLFKEYHDKYPTHGYRWLKAKIELDLGVIYSDNYSQRVCSEKRGDRMTYYNGLENLIKKKEAYKDLVTILHTDQGSVYASKSFNELAQLNNIIHSMSRPGTSTDNSNMEAINGWLKEELFNDFNIKDSNNIKNSIEEYIYFFNNERPAYALNYLTPKQFKDKYSV